MSERPLFERPLDDLLPARSEAAPRGGAPPAGAVARDRPDAELAAIARYQKWLIRIILLHILLVVGWVGANFLAGPVEVADALPGVIAVAVAGAALSVAALGVEIVLASKLYGPATAVAFGLCQFIPCGGGLVLLVVNARATTELRRNGIRVGLLGARRADLAALTPRPRGDGRMPKLGW